MCCWRSSSRMWSWLEREFILSFFLVWNWFHSVFRVCLDANCDFNVCLDEECLRRNSEYDWRGTKRRFVFVIVSAIAPNACIKFISHCVVRLSTTNGIPMCVLIIFYLVMALFKRWNSSSPKPIRMKEETKKRKKTYRNGLICAQALTRRYLVCRYNIHSHLVEQFIKNVWLFRLVIVGSVRFEKFRRNRFNH